MVVPLAWHAVTPRVWVCHEDLANHALRERMQPLRAGLQRCSCTAASRCEMSTGALQRPCAHAMLYMLARGTPWAVTAMSHCLANRLECKIHQGCQQTEDCPAHINSHPRDGPSYQHSTVGTPVELLGGLLEGQVDEVPVRLPHLEGGAAEQLGSAGEDQLRHLVKAAKLADGSALHPHS